MIHIVIEGEHVPLKKDGGDEKKKKLFKRTDPIALLRNALANKLRSKHWRIAHAAKSKWLAAAKAGAKVKQLSSSSTPSQEDATSTHPSKYCSTHSKKTCSQTETTGQQSPLSSDGLTPTEKQ